jgi:hypothetical protein
MQPFMSASDALVTMGILIACNFIISLFKKKKKDQNVRGNK